MLTTMYSLLLLSLLSTTAVRAGTLPIKRVQDKPPADGKGNKALDAKTLAAAFKEGVKLSGTKVNDNFTAQNVETYGFEGCHNDDPARIYSGWAQAQAIASLGGRVDYNSAGAVEYLGAPGLNHPYQGAITDLLTNFAQWGNNRWNHQYNLHIRCDDYHRLCRENSNAWTMTSDPLSDGNALINFCPRYFTLPHIDDLFNSRDPPETRLNLEHYNENQGTILLHELFHIDYFSHAVQYGHNEHIRDLTIEYRDEEGDRESEAAYGPLFTKVLARYPTNTGKYIMRNADNLNMFLTSAYVQWKLGNIYPHYPLVNFEPTRRAPYRPGPPGVYDIFKFQKDGTVVVDETTLKAIKSQDNHVEPQSTDKDDSDSKPLDLTKLAPDSAYPKEYISSYKSWLASATKSGEKPSSTSTKPNTHESTPTDKPDKKPDYAAKGSKNGKYGKDKCHLHLWQIKDCNQDGFNLKAKLQIWDAEAREILPITKANRIDADHAQFFKSPLPHPMYVTGELRGDYVQFTMGNVSFKSTDKLDEDKNQPGQCGVGGWDPKHLGPNCMWDTSATSTRQMDCYFDCPYNS